MEPLIRTPFIDRWYGRLILILLTVGLLTLAFAPVYQFYCAWVGLVPWLLIVRRTTSPWRAFFWSWLAGTLFFIANMWWMAYVTVPGMIGLMAVLGLFWGIAGVVIRGMGLLGNGESEKDDATSRPPSSILHPRFNTARIFLFASIWVAIAEWFRGSWPWHGLPWLYLGHSQSPILPMCQIADITGVAGISFGVALINGWMAMFFLNRFRLSGLIRSGAAVAVVLVLTFAYGVFRIAQTSRVTSAGPTVMVIQCNYPQSNSGAKGASQEEMTGFHIQTSYAALKERAQKGLHTDLVVWSETMMPPINPEARERFRGSILEQTSRQIQNLAFELRTAVLTGGRFWNKFKETAEGAQPTDDRNAAYLYQSSGLQADERYDKIHLVPFGEFIPFKETFPALYRLMINLGPPNMEDYQLTSGDEANLTVFPLNLEPSTVGRGTIKFVTPICFEDIDANIVAHMFRPETGSNKKRADFMVNLTNDGWFKANENSQHLQTAIFRSIENRAPTARSVNTGISGFIDSLGRTHDLLTVRTSGVSTADLTLDSRVTFFTLFGDLFSRACVVITSGLIVFGLIRRYIKKRPVVV